jgi:hypothetical protein
MQSDHNKQLITLIMISLSGFHRIILYLKTFFGTFRFLCITTAANLLIVKAVVVEAVVVEAVVVEAVVVGRQVVIIIDDVLGRN